MTRALVASRDPGDLDGAARALVDALRSGHPRWSSLARVTLGVIRAGQGDVAAAEKAYCDVIAQGTDRAATGSGPGRPLGRRRGDGR